MRCTKLRVTCSLLSYRGTLTSRSRSYSSHHYRYPRKVMVGTVPTRPSTSLSLSSTRASASKPQLPDDPQQHGAIHMLGPRPSPTRTIQRPRRPQPSPTLATTQPRLLIRPNTLLRAAPQIREPHPRSRIVKGAHLQIRVSRHAVLDARDQAWRERDGLRHVAVCVDGGRGAVACGAGFF
jgi:hypothetical protein